ncbi:hypothetical protein BsWGS_07474 [Bradybaena similaris]
MEKQKPSFPEDRLFLTQSRKSLSVDEESLVSQKNKSKDGSKVLDRNIPSPYDTAKGNRLYKKLYPNRVYTPWYRRYVNKLPEVESIDFQPFDEVQKVDEDIALQYFYGEDAVLRGSVVDRNYSEKRKTALQSYRRVKDQEERTKAQAAEVSKMGSGAKVKWVQNAKEQAATMESEFGATAVEQKLYSPIVTFLHKLHIGKQRLLRKVVLKTNSKWKILKSPNVLRKLRDMYRTLIQDMIHARFRRVIRMVVAVIRFIETIRLISGNTKKILREIENFLTSQTQDTDKINIYGAKKKIFDPHKYNISKELHIPFETKLTLTKPWFTRRDDEIDMVVKALQSYKSFVQYPPLFQRRLATLAWYIEAQADKYIIRERHIACDFYVLLTGKAKVVKMRGSPYIYERGELTFIRYIRKSEGFGDESMSDPECEREYSVISTEPCALLSISVHDYLQMLSTRKEDEFAPEHIIFLCNLRLMDKFPKVKLLEEGNENITIHYFRPETVVSKNLEDSNFVFVVFSGSCLLLAEIFPSIIASQRRDQSVARVNRKKSVKKGSIKFQPSFTRMLGTKCQSGTFLPKNTWMKQQIDSQRKALEPMFASTGATIRDYQEKTQQIMRTLPRQLRNELYDCGIPRPTTIKSKKGDAASTKEELTQPLTNVFSNFYHRMKSATSIADIVDNSTYPSSRSSFLHEADERNTSQIKEKTKRTVSLLPQSDSSQVSLGEEEKQPFVSRQVSLGEEEKLSRQVSMGEEEKQPFVSRQVSIGEEAKHFFVQSSEREREDSIHSDEPIYVMPTRKSLAPEKRPHALPQLHSRWKHVKTLSRGDYTGHEWLDYRDKPYEPPEEIMSLVSRGCEMVMVKKAFLLKYLRREW